MYDGHAMIQPFLCENPPTLLTLYLPLWLWLALLSFSLATRLAQAQEQIFFIFMELHHLPVFNTEAVTMCSLPDLRNFFPHILLSVSSRHSGKGGQSRGLGM